MGKTPEVDDFYYQAAGENPPAPFTFRQAIQGLKLPHRGKDGKIVPGNEANPEVKDQIETALKTEQMKNLQERSNKGEITIAHMAVLGAITFFVAEQSVGEINLPPHTTIEQVDEFFSPVEERNNEQTPPRQ